MEQTEEMRSGGTDGGDAQRWNRGELWRSCRAKIGCGDGAEERLEVL